MKKLNLGCGEFKKQGYINLDISAGVGPDVAHNLEQFPYPFDDAAFDLIEANHVLEHLSDPFRVMAELNRILKPGGRILIRVPHFSRAMSHPQHKRGFDVTFPFYFRRDFKGGYTGTPLVCERSELHWFAQHRLMKQTLSPGVYWGGCAVGRVLDFFAGLSPLFCSRVWCFWVGGFYEIEFLFKKP